MRERTCSPYRIIVEPRLAHWEGAPLLALYPLIDVNDMEIFVLGKFLVSILNYKILFNMPLLARQ